MKTRVSAVLALFVLTLFSTRGQVPQLIHYQGRVAVNGVNFDGKGQFKFALITTNKPGQPVTLWSNNGTSVAGSEPSIAVVLTVSQGLYSVLLGDTSLANMTALPITVFNEPSVWLRVWFNDGKNGSQRITPDQRIAAVGYAMIAGAVVDGAITGAKLAPGAALANMPDGSVPIDKLTPAANAGQVLITDTSGALKWESPVALSNYLNRAESALANATENSADVEIAGLTTNRVVIVRGPAMRFDEVPAWDPNNGFYGMKPVDAEMLPFVFEYAGAAASKFVTDLNAARTNYPFHQIKILIRDTNNVIRVTWTLNQMELTRIEPGTEGRMRYTFECFDSPLRSLQYTRNPESLPNNLPLKTDASSSDPFVEISGVNVTGQVPVIIDPENRTLTITFDYEEGRDLVTWFKTIAQDFGQPFLATRSMSIIRQAGFRSDGFPVEVGRINYYEIYPIKYEQIGGFGNRDKLKERITIRYAIRERA